MEPPTPSFLNLGIAPKTLSLLERMKIMVPTPIQHKAIPVALDGQDVVGIAQTGTGKTLAFGIPLVQRIVATNGRALVLVPTRELALQVGGVLRDVLQPFGFQGAVLIGGAPIFRQIKALRKNPRILIATPGRLVDHIERKTVSLKNVNLLVLDEADRMFDMGFAPQVKRILNYLPKERQTMLFSATLPVDIARLASRHMKLPIHVEVAPSGTAAERVSHELFIVREESKRTLLKLVLDQYRGSILLFTRTKIKARKIAKFVRDKNHQVVEIHSDRSMAQRKQAIEGFKQGRYRVLVATDIAARGIDVQNIELVINYDLPDDAENYVHRIGRTGRAGLEGKAISFATPDQGAEVGRIEKLIRKDIPRGTHPEMPEDDFQTLRKFTTRKRTFRPRWGRRRR